MQANDNATPRLAFVADDDPDQRQLLAHILRRAGFNVHVASDGQELIELCGAHGPPDLIISDLVMPRLSGFGVLAAVREQVGETVPVVLVSALGDAETRDLAVRLGATEMMHKPFDYAALRELVDRVTRHAA